jgi:hypothetical protein
MNSEWDVFLVKRESCGFGIISRKQFFASLQNKPRTELGQCVPSKSDDARVNEELGLLRESQGLFQRNEEWLLSGLLRQVSHTQQPTLSSCSAGRMLFIHCYGLFKL